MNSQNISSSANHVSWRRILAIVWTAQFICAVGFSFGLPFAPFFLQEELGVSKDQLPFWVALFGASLPFTMTIFQPIWGAVSDRFGRKKMLLRSYLGGIISVGSMAFVQDPVTLIALRLLQGVFSGTLSAAQTLVSVNTPEEHNGFALGSLNSAMFSGTLIGAFAGGFVADIYGYRIAFLISGILMTVAFLLVFFGIQEKAEALQKEKPVIAGKEKNHFWKSLLLPHPVFIAVWPVLGMMSGVMFTRQFDTSFLPLFVQNIHGSVSGASSWTGALSAVTGTAGALSGFIMGWLADRYRPGRLAVMSALLAAVFMSSLYFCDSFSELFPLRFFMIFFSSGLDPALQIWLAQSTPPASRGLVFGWACSMRCCGNFSAPLIAGCIVQQSSIRELFLAGPLCYQLLICGFLLLSHRMKKRQNESAAL